MVPPGGKYFYDDPDTGTHFQMSSHEALVAAVVRHRQANNKPVPRDISEQIADWLCRRLPDGFCVDENGAVTAGTGRATVEQIIRNTRKVQQDMRDHCVREDVAETRIRICERCPENAPAAGCAACVGLDQVIRDMQRGRHTARDSKVFACRLSGAFIAIEAWCDEPAAIRKAQYPAHCWKLKLMEAR